MHPTTTAQYVALAGARVTVLDLPLWVLVDESGQTSEREHARWLATAPEAEIRQWIADIERDTTTTTTTTTTD